MLGSGVEVLVDQLLHSCDEHSSSAS
jgi:hypothetical protein